jgi:hypothetical protein
MKRFDPLLAADVARRYGTSRLRFRSSWLKVTIPEALLVEAARQEHHESVPNMIQALGQHEQIMSAQTFRTLSARSIAKSLPPGEASQYVEAMGVR